MKIDINKLLIALLLFILPIFVLFSGCNGTSTNKLEGKIAFISGKGAEYNLCLMNADGSHQTKLTTGLRIDGSPSWSPDGKKIAFVSGRIGGKDERTDIYTINADGTGEKRLSWDNLGNFRPSWSPDGNKIIFICGFFRDGNSNFPVEEIYMMDADGSNETRLTYYYGHCSYPRWSPNGSRIIFSFYSGQTSNTGIYTINKDGTNRVSIIRGEFASSIYASFSPDGSKIVFVATPHPKSTVNIIPPGIYIMNADGSNPIRLSRDDITEGSPSWSPDGRNIVFSSSRDSTKDNRTRQIYVMNADGSHQTKLTDNPGLKSEPAWSR